MSGFSSAGEYADTFCQGGLEGELTVGTTAIPVRVGADNLDGRQEVTIQSMNNSLYYGYTPGVTAATGTRIFRNQSVSIPVSAGVDVYIVGNTAGRTARITEVG